MHGSVSRTAATPLSISQRRMLHSLLPAWSRAGGCKAGAPALCPVDVWTAWAAGHQDWVCWPSCPAPCMASILRAGEPVLEQGGEWCCSLAPGDPPGFLLHQLFLTGFCTKVAGKGLIFILHEPPSRTSSWTECLGRDIVWCSALLFGFTSLRSVT